MRTELERVQEALAHLPRPTAPPRLRRAVMAQIAKEARTNADASQAWTWSRTEADGWTTERWEGVERLGDTVSAPAAAHVIHTHWHHEESGRTTIYQFTQTD